MRLWRAFFRIRMHEPFRTAPRADDWLVGCLALLGLLALPGLVAILLGAITFFLFSC